MNENIAEIDGSKILDSESFHKVFKESLEFVEGYGNNMDAWIDCMRDIHQDTGMSAILLPKSESLILKITSTSKIEQSDPKIIETLSSCTAFVNEYLSSRNEGLIYLLFI